MQPDKLMIVAHPDDEVLWGGLNLLSQPGWFVVCSTHANHPERSQEFYKTMKLIGGDIRFKMFDVPDVFTYDDRVADALYNDTPFDLCLRELASQSWKVVLTHNEVGEYGHAHHKKVHRMVKTYFRNPTFFGLGFRLSPVQINKKRELLRHYTSQECPMAFFNSNESTRPSGEQYYFFNEVILFPPPESVTQLLPIRLSFLNRKTSSRLTYL